MRPPSDMPPRPPRRRQSRRGRRLPSGRGRVVLIVVLVALFVLATSIRGIAGFYTDYLWFDSLDLAGVWRGVLGAKTALALIFIGIFFVLMWTNLLIADRIAPTFRLATGPEDDLVERYHELVGTRAGMLRTGVSLLLALIVGSGVSAQWKDWILFTNRVDFGQKDATFNTDIGFYVFQLPFLKFVLGWMFSALIVVLLATLVAHYLNGGIRVQVPGPAGVAAGEGARVGAARHPVARPGRPVLARALRPRVLDPGDGRRRHLHRRQRAGEGHVPADDHLDHRVRAVPLQHPPPGWVLPGIAVGLWLFVIVLAGETVPALVQRFRVKPDEPSKEAIYIRHNIAATRDALGLERGRDPQLRARRRARQRGARKTTPT